MSYKQTVFAVFLAGLSSFASAEPKVEIQKIAGRTPTEVAKIARESEGRM